MTDLSLQPIQTDNLESTHKLYGRVLHVKLKGAADQDAVEPVTQFFGELQKAVTDHEIGEVLIDFRELELLSASCFKRFAWWLEEVMSVAKPEQVRFLSTRKYMWQRFSLEALSAFAEGRVSVAESE